MPKPTRCARPRRRPPSSPHCRSLPTTRAALRRSDGHQWATAAGSDNIIGENVGLFRYFSYGDAEQCPIANGGNHAGTLGDPYGCDGVWPDIDVAMQRIRLNDIGLSRDYPEIGLHLEPLVPGDMVTLAGFGRQYPCEWAGMLDITRDFYAKMGDALKVCCPCCCCCCCCCCCYLCRRRRRC